MKRLYISIFLSLYFFQMSVAQSDTVVKYYSNNNGKEVSMSKAKYSTTTFTNADGSVTTVERDMKKDKVTYSSTYKGDEPFGIWKTQYGDKMIDMDYNFTLNYSCQLCNDTPSKQPGYIEPVFSVEENAMIRFLGSNIIYPAYERDNDIQGKVILRCTLTEKGDIENVCVVKGAHVGLDKESVRVAKLLKFKEPAKLNGRAITACVTLPVVFKLQ